MSLGRWQKAILDVMRTRNGIAKSRMETITTPDGRVYVPLVSNYSAACGKTSNNFSAMWKALDGLIKRGIIKKDNGAFVLNEKAIEE